MDFNEVVALVKAEREYQDQKWGGPAHDSATPLLWWLTYISKFVGKLAKAIMDRDRYEAMTLGQLMRTLTATLSSERQHIGGADCWCCPTVEFKDPVSGAAVWIHRSMQ